MHNFTPFAAILGGIFIAISAIVLLISNGRLAGISGIASQLLLTPRKHNLWQLFFLIGLVLGSLLVYQITTPYPLRQHFPPLLLAMAGLCVGIGTALANGCTSGHGVCGLSRFSLRSLLATCLFLLTGIITTYVMRHIIGN